MNHEVYLSTGGNIGNRKFYLDNASSQIKKRIGRTLKKSSIYESDPWGFKSETRFLNQVLSVETIMSPYEILFEINKIETLYERKRTDAEGYMSRTLDIDILFYDNLTVNDRFLKIPHPEIHRRLFILKPLEEIAPELIHPIFNMNISRLIIECTDRGDVKKYRL